MRSVSAWMIEEVDNEYVSMAGSNCQIELGNGCRSLYLLTSMILQVKLKDRSRRYSSQQQIATFLMQIAYLTPPGRQVLPPTSLFKYQLEEIRYRLR